MNNKNKNIKFQNSSYATSTSSKRRTVKPDAYKTQCETYWKNFFKKLEEEMALPIDQRKEYVQEFVDPNTFHRISNVLKFSPDPTRKSFSPEVESLKPDAISDEVTVSTEINVNDQSKQAIPELSDTLESSTDIKSTETVKSKSKSKKCNPFVNYLNKSPEEARIWRPKPPPDLKHKPLVEKSELLTQKIVSEFCEWCKTLGPNDENSVLTEKNILKMFDIWSDTFAIKALCVSLQEMASVPTSVAEATNLPQKSERNVLHQQIMDDIIAESGRKHTVAFGTTLPPDLAVVPPSNCTYKKWIQNPHIKEELKTMEHVWNGITDISSVRAYCNWLAANPHLIRPPFLQNIIKEEFPKKRLERADSRTSTEYSTATEHNSTQVILQLRKTLSEVTF